MKKKLKQFHAIELNLWDCNNNSYKAWNIVDRKLDKTIAQGWDRAATIKIVALLNGVK